MFNAPQFFQTLEAMGYSESWQNKDWFDNDSQGIRILQDDTQIKVIKFQGKPSNGIKEWDMNLPASMPNEKLMALISVAAA